MKNVKATEEKNFVIVQEIYQCNKCYKFFNEICYLSEHNCSLKKINIQVLERTKISPKKNKISFQNVINRPRPLSKQNCSLKKELEQNSSLRKETTDPCTLLNQNSLYKKDNCPSITSKQTVSKRSKNDDSVSSEYNTEFQEDTNIRSDSTIEVMRKAFNNSKNDENISQSTNIRRFCPLKLKCNICDKKFPSIKDYISHKKKHNPNITILATPLSESSSVKIEANCSNVIPKMDRVSEQKRNDNSVSSENDAIFQNDNEMVDSSIHESKGSSNISKSIEKTSEPAQSRKCFSLIHNCDVCDAKFSQKRALIKHKRIHTSNKIKCSNCGEEFTKKEDFSEHRKKHSVEKSFQCDYCGKKFAWKRSLSRHNDSVHLNRKKSNHKCNICEKMFADPWNLKRHSKLHAVVKPYICEFCNKAFPIKEYLRVHLAIHSEERPYLCDLCGKLFKTKISLRLHSGRHNPNRPKSRFETTEYQKRFYRRLICDICDKGFPKRKLLESHYRIHTNERPFECDECGKKFRSERLLKNHSQVHSNLRYVCEKCCRVYSSRKTLKDHMKIHDDSKAYKCEVCSKRFSVKSALVTHQVCHTKEKPFECDICHKIYSFKSSLDKHPCAQATKSDADDPDVFVVQYDQES